MSAGRVEQWLQGAAAHPLSTRLMRWWWPNERDVDGADVSALRGSRLIVRAIALLLLALLLWSLLCTLDVASHSTGEVTSAGQTKLVQHLEGGIVRRILVREGEAVRAGQPLAEVERVAADADLREIEAQQGALQIRALRLQAQLDDHDDFAVPAELAARFPDQAETARALFIAQKSRIGSSYEAQLQKMAQRRAEEVELRARRAHVSSKLKLLMEQIAISEKLLADGLANRFEHLNLLKEEELARGTLHEIDASLKRTAAALKQETAALELQGSGDDEEIQKELAETRRMLSELAERLRKFSDTQQRLVVRAPIDGVVMTLQVVTEGGVIQPGGTLMTLVPANEPLLIEARLPVGDIGMVRVGQEARIQLVSSLARGFQPIGGKVVEISPDSVLGEDKIPYFRVRLAPEQEAFEHRGSRYPLLPGVPVSVAILTGERSLFSYMTGPLTDELSLAFTEP
jgi:adhesin transport system membrane fusion protein